MLLNRFLKFVFFISIMTIFGFCVLFWVFDAAESIPDVHFNLK